MPSKGAGAFFSGRSDAVNRRFTALSVAGALFALLAFAFMAVPAASNAAGAPVASDLVVQTNDATPVDVSLSATESPDSYAIATQPTGGSLSSFNAAAGTVTYTASPTFAGIDSFTYTATNTDGTSQPATVTVLVRPQSVIDSGPTGLTNDSTPTFAFSSPQAEMLFECRINLDAWASCTSPFTSGVLADGEYTFAVRARAGAGGPQDLTPATRTFQVDATPATVDLGQAAGQADPTGLSPIEFALSSDQSLAPATVTNSDFTVTNGTIASITPSDSDKLFTIAVTPTADGAVTIEPSGTFSVEDPAGNKTDTAGGADRSVTYEAAEITLDKAAGQADPTNQTPISFTVSSSKDLDAATVTTADFTATNGTVESVTGSGDTFTVEVEASAEGNVQLSAAAGFEVEDTFGVPQVSVTGTPSVAYDITAPSMSFQSADSQADPTNNASISFTLASNEDLDPTTVTTEDFSADNGTVDSVTGSGKTFTVTVIASTEGDVSAAPSGAFSVRDLAGNVFDGNPTGAQRTVVYDATAPTVTLEKAASQAALTDDDEIEFTLSSDEGLDSSTVTAGDFTADNGTVDSVTGSGDTFTITVTATAQGEVTISPSGTFSVSDPAGNAQTTAGGSDRTVRYNLPAEMTLSRSGSQAETTGSNPISFELKADRPLDAATVTGSDFSVTNGTNVQVSGTGDTYTIAVDAVAGGAVTLTKSATFEVTDIYTTDSTDVTGEPSVTYEAAEISLTKASGQADPTNQTPISFTVSSSKDLDAATVTTSDFEATRGTVSAVTGSGDTFNVEVEATAEGSVQLSAAAGFEVRDDFGVAQASVTGTPSVTYDTTAPTITFDTKPSDQSQDRDPEFEFDAGEMMTDVECRLDSSDEADWESCSSPYAIEDISLGAHTFEVRAKDAAGNLGSASYSWTVIDSTISASVEEDPVFTRGGDPVEFAIQATDTESGTLSFSLQSSTGGGTVGSFIVAGNRASAEYQTGNGFAGDDSVTIRIRNADTGSYRDVTFSVIVKPKTVLLSGPGVGSTPGLTNDNTPTVSFDAVSGPNDGSVDGAGFTCRLNGQPLPSGDCSSKSWTPASALEDGDYTFEVRAFKGANTDDGFQKAEFTVDTVNPEAPELDGPEGLTNDNDLEYAITLPEGTAECRLIAPRDSNPDFAACESPVAYDEVVDGDYTFEARTVDGAGNRSSVSSLSVEVDTVVDVTINQAPGAENRQVAVEIDFSSSEDPETTYTCSLTSDNPLYGEGAFGESPLFEDETCTSGTIDLGPLYANGEHEFTVEATDPAGNKSSDSASWTQANTAPAVPEPLDTVEAGESVTVDIASTDADGDEIAYSVIRLNTVGNGDGGAGGAPVVGEGPDACPEGESLVPGGCAGPVDQETGEFSFTADGASAGTYEIEFEAEDNREGGLTEGTATVRVQPGTVIVEEPRTPFNDTTPTWTFESPSGVETFECDLDGAGYEPCDGGSFTPEEELADGPHALAVRAVAEGDLKDPTPGTSGPIVVDTVAPDVEITDTPVELSNVADPEFGFESTDGTATFECSVDGGEFAECEPGGKIAALTDGDHTFTVRAVDPATNVGDEADPYEWEVDITDPEFEITSGPDEGDWTNARRPVWEFDESDKNLIEGSLRCRVNNGVWVNDCPKPWQATANLPDGLHKIQLEADDGAGNIGAYEAEFRVATLAPVAIVDEGPDSPSGPNVEFVFDSASELGPEGGFECRTARNAGAFGAWEECESPYALEGLDSGNWSLQVRAVDSAGNRSTGAGVGSWVWSTNAIVPNAEITAVNASNGSAAFGFRATNDPLASFECRLDGGSWDACTSPKSYSNLAVGEHTFEVRAISTVGTVGEPDEHVWIVEAPLAPDTTITRRPPVETTSSRATFEFNSDDPIATFECRLDGGSWEACTSPKVYEGLDTGQRTFEVRATGSNGATDSSPAVHSWSVVSEIVDPIPARLAATVSAPKSARAGAQIDIRIRLANSGTEAAQGARVCLSAPKVRAAVSGSRCKTVDVAAKGSATVSYKVNTKKGKKGRTRFRVSIEYQSDGGPQTATGGHTTILK